MKFVIPVARILAQSLMTVLILCVFFSADMDVSAAENEPSELLIGIEPEHNIFDQMERYRYLADFLSAQLGLKVRLTIMSRYGEVIKRFKNLELDGAFLTPYTATMGVKELKLVPLASPVNLNGESTSQGYVFVRKDNAMRQILDMRGGNIVFVDPASMEGYLFPVAYLKKLGIEDISKFYKRYFFSGSHASAVFAVLDGRADIGSAKSTVYDDLAKKDPSIKQELRILAKSIEVPETTLCVRSEIPRDLRERLTDALLQMNKSPEGLKALEQFNAKRFVKTEKSDFAKIEEMALKSLGALTVHGK